jgi:digeranylgeranylglycerophospholipid reductase
VLRVKNVPDAIIVGGGPCGSHAALKLAQRGVKVTVFEEHNQIGFPSHCAGHISIKGLANLGLLPLSKEVVENTFYAAHFHSPNGNRFSVRFQSPVTYAVDRALFDKQLADKAADAGAEYRPSSRVESLIMEKGFVRGVAVKHDGQIEKKTAGIVLDAEGVSSRLLRQTGLAGLDRRMLINGVEAEVGNVKDAEPDAVEVFLGEEYAPGFYAWLIPKKDGKAKVGLGARNGNPKQLLQRLMTKHPAASKKLHNAKILQTSFHSMTLGGPVKQAYSNGFLAVGDAASQVKPTTGGGVVLGLTCANIAAEVASEALSRNNVSATFLKTYQTRCDEAVGFDARTMLRMRKTLDLISDKRLNDVIAMCARLGLDKTLQKVKDIDFQGHALLHVLRSPRTLTALGYFFLVYLSANP